MKTCCRCKRELPLDQFSLVKERNGQPASRCKQCACAATNKYRAALRAKIFNLFGNRCECCGEERSEFLTIDHVKGGGSKRRRDLGRKGTTYYYLMMKEGIKEGEYRCLCMNCNFSLGIRGYCPHEREANVRAHSA